MWDLPSSLSLRLQPLLQGGRGGSFTIAIAPEIWELSSLSLSGSVGSRNVISSVASSCLAYYLPFMYIVSSSLFP